MKLGYWRKGLDGIGHPTEGPDWDFTTDSRVVCYPGGFEIVWARGKRRHATTARFKFRGESPVEVSRSDAARIVWGVRQSLRR